jgi:hypothetical protein
VHNSVVHLSSVALLYHCQLYFRCIMYKYIMHVLEDYYAYISCIVRYVPYAHSPC